VCLCVVSAVADILLGQRGDGRDSCNKVTITANSNSSISKVAGHTIAWKIQFNIIATSSGSRETHHSKQESNSLLHRDWCFSPRPKVTRHGMVNPNSPSLPSCNSPISRLCLCRFAQDQAIEGCCSIIRLVRCEQIGHLLTII
jgi:hypothetical protein